MTTDDARHSQTRTRFVPTARAALLSRALQRRPDAIPAPTAAMLAAVLLAAGLGACGNAPARRGASVATTPTVPRTSATRPSTVKPKAAGAGVTLAFGGDVHFEGVLAGRLARDPTTALGPIATVLGGADLAIVNLETAITTRGTPQPKQFTFRAPPTAFVALRAAGVDVATMANNHALDYGPVGLADTLAAAAATRFPLVGIGHNVAEAFRPYRVTIHGQRLAIIGTTQVLDDTLAAAWTAGGHTPGLAAAWQGQDQRLVGAVRAAHATGDTVIVDLHWGQELQACPTQPQRTLTAHLVAAGADVVVGSHAHVLLGSGWLGHTYIDYGLGNLAFSTAGGLTARTGVLLLTLRGHAVTTARLVPAVLASGIPVALSGTAADRAVATWQAERACTGLSASPS